MARTAISAGLGRSVPTAQITAALTTLAEEGRAESRVVRTGKRPREEWRARARNNEDMNISVPDAGRSSPERLNSSYIHNFGTSAADEREVWEP